MLLYRLITLTQRKEREDVGLGSGVCSGGAVRAVIARFADSGAGSQPIR